MENLAIGHAFSLRNIFMNFPVEKLKMTVKQCKDIFSDGNKRDLAAAIFARSVEIIVNDIIENNNYFKLPTLGKSLAYLGMRRTTGEKFKKAFKRGKWRDVDFIMSNFTGYLLELKMDSGRRLPKSKPIYISEKYKQKITDYTNLGKQY